MSGFYEYTLAIDIPTFAVSLDIDGVPFTFRFDYQAKSDRFFLSIYSATGDAIRKGIKVLSGFNFLRMVTRSDKPSGAIVFLDLADAEGEPPSLRDLGRRVRLFHLTTAS